MSILSKSRLKNVIDNHYKTIYISVRSECLFMLEMIYHFSPLPISFIYRENLGKMIRYSPHVWGWHPPLGNAGSVTAQALSKGRFKSRYWIHDFFLHLRVSRTKIENPRWQIRRDIIPLTFGKYLELNHTWVKVMRN